MRTRPRSSGNKSAQDEQCQAADAVTGETERLFSFLNELFLSAARNRSVVEMETAVVHGPC